MITDLFDALSAQQQWTLERLWQRGGVSCGLPVVSLRALEAQELIDVYRGPEGGRRVCEIPGHQVQLHYHYTIPPEICRPYEQWRTRVSPPPCPKTPGRPRRAQTA